MLCPQSSDVPRNVKQGELVYFQQSRTAIEPAANFFEYFIARLAIGTSESKLLCCLIRYSKLIY